MPVITELPELSLKHVLNGRAGTKGTGSIGLLLEEKMFNFFFHTLA